MDLSFFCYICLLHFSEISDVIKHLKNKHILIDKNQRHKCCINQNCNLTYATYSGLKKHCISKICVKVGSVEQTITLTATIDNDFQNDVQSLINLTPQNVTSKCISENVVPRADPAEFVHEMESFGLPQSTITGILSSVSKLVNDTLDSILTKAPSTELSQAIDIAKDPFKNLQTTHMRKKMYRKSETYVQPLERKIGIGMKNKYDRITKSYKLVPVPLTYMYVPIQESILNILKNYDVFNFIMKDPVSTPDVYENYSDGSNYGTLPHSSSNKILFLQ